MDLENRWHRLFVLAAVAIVSVAATLSAALYARNVEYRLARTEHAGAAATQAVLIRRQLAEAVATIEGMADAARVNPQFTKSAFYRYAELALDRHPMLFALIWAEWVNHEERGAAVQAMRADGFEIPDLLTRGPDGEAVPAPQRSRYLVVRHFAPAEIASHFVGVDAMSLPGRAEPVMRGIETGEATATPPVWTALDETPSVLVGVPVYETVLPPDTVEERIESVVGTVAVGFMPQPMLSRWMNQEEEPVLQRTLLVADDGPAGPQVMFDSLAGTTPPDVDASDLEAILAHPLAIKEPAPFADRQWQVVTVPTQAFVESWRSAATPWVVLGLGALASLLLTGLVGVSLRHGASVRRFADERAEQTAELAYRVREQEKAQLSLAEANERLRATNEEMEQFVSAVSHDLKNPLLAVELMCHVAHDGIERGDNEETQQAMRRLSQSVRMMRRIIDDLIAHSRAGFAAFKGEMVDMDGLVRNIMADHIGEAHERGVLLQLEGRLPRIYGDRGRLSAIFDNLLGNAVKYAGPGSEDDERYAVIGCEEVAGGESEGLGHGAWRFFVRDNGPGVSEEHRERIFKLFERFGGDGQSTGIGLAIVARAAKAHGGRAWVEPTPGGGTTFIVEIPRLEPREPRDEIDERDEQEERRGSVSVTHR